jgi:alpha-2,3 sialyltransferase
MTRDGLGEVLSKNAYTRLLPVIKKNEEPLIVAGSGPSLQRINYKRLPKDFLTFRINNFFLEDKYYLGKRVDLCYASMPRPETIYTLLSTITEYEYDFTHDFFLTSQVVTKGFGNFNYFPRIEIERILSIDNKAFSYLAQTYYFQKKHVTSGILSLLTAIALGFKDIYLVGIDFYSDDDQRYGYKIGENYRKTVNDEDLQAGYSSRFHSREIDLKGLDLALSYEGVKIRSVCDDAFINQFIDLSPEGEEFFSPTSKEDGHINDYIIPKIVKDKEPIGEFRKLINREIKNLKNTMLIRFLYGFILKPLFVIPIRIIFKILKTLITKNETEI